MGKEGGWRTERLAWSLSLGQDSFDDDGDVCTDVESVFFVVCEVFSSVALSAVLAAELESETAIFFECPEMAICDGPLTPELGLGTKFLSRLL